MIYTYPAPRKHHLRQELNHRMKGAERANFSSLETLKWGVLISNVVSAGFLENSIFG